MSKSMKCGCGRPAVDYALSSGRCAVCKAIEERMPSDYHPNHAPKARLMHDTRWSAETQRMINRGYAAWCLRHGQPEAVLLR